MKTSGKNDERWVNGAVPVLKLTAQFEKKRDSIQEGKREKGEGRREKWLLRVQLLGNFPVSPAHRLP
jgi:hypothetical protein